MSLSVKGLIHDVSSSIILRKIGGQDAQLIRELTSAVVDEVYPFLGNAITSTVNFQVANFRAFVSRVTAKKIQEYGNRPSNHLNEPLEIGNEKPIVERVVRFGSEIFREGDLVSLAYTHSVYGNTKTTGIIRAIGDLSMRIGSDGLVVNYQKILNIKGSF